MQLLYLYVHSPGDVFSVILFRRVVFFYLRSDYQKSSRPRIETVLYNCSFSLTALVFREEKRVQIPVIITTWRLRLQRRHTKSRVNREMSENFIMPAGEWSPGCFQHWQYRYASIELVREQKVE